MPVNSTALVDGEAIVGITDVQCSDVNTIVVAEAQLRVEQCFVFCTSHNYGPGDKDSRVNSRTATAFDSKPCTTAKFHVTGDGRWAEYTTADRGEIHNDSAWTQYECFQIPDGPEQVLIDPHCGDLGAPGIYTYDDDGPDLSVCPG